MLPLSSSSSFSNLSYSFQLRKQNYSYDYNHEGLLSLLGFYFLLSKDHFSLTLMNDEWHSIFRMKLLFFWIFPERCKYFFIKNKLWNYITSAMWLLFKGGIQNYLTCLFEVVGLFLVVNDSI